MKQRDMDIATNTFSYYREILCDRPNNAKTHRDNKRRKLQRKDAKYK
jgi:hypothetical protein